MTADIITIGDEILIGQILDTNSQYIAAELTKSGISIRQIKSISDDENAIKSALDLSVGVTDFVIITGGLGPTNDDITKSTLGKYFGGNLIIHEETIEQLKLFFKSRGREITDRNLKQAEIPDTCVVLTNKSGTAPGMIFNKNKTLVFSLPGVPFEMKELLLNGVLPYIKNNFTLPIILQRTILIEGIAESTLADLLKTWEENIDKRIKIAYLPSPGILRLRLSISGSNSDELKYKLGNEIQHLTDYIGIDSVFGYDSETLEQVIGKLLIDNEMTLSIAESCTGGNISHLITSVPGCSKYFIGSVIAYDNRMKVEKLNVPSKKIEQFGAVSREVAEYMAKGIQLATNSDTAIATTGIAGPDGGTPEKPVGTVWISVILREKIISKKFLFGENRERNIIRASLSALNMLRNLLRAQ